MATVSLSLPDDASRWLRRRSRELGVTPDAFVSDLLARGQAAEEFRALSDDVGRSARDRGLTDEVLADLLDGDDLDA
jgi:hypothetical protein